MKTTFNTDKNINNYYSVPHKYKPKKLGYTKAVLLSMVSLLGTSCSTLAGGNFIFDENNNKIERFTDYQKENHLSGKDTYYNADTLQMEDLVPNLDANRSKILPTKDKYILEYFAKEGLQIQPNIYSKNYLNSVNLDNWIAENQEKLVGSCIFTQKDDELSKLIVAFTTGSSYKNEFVPSHTATIFEKNGEMKILNILAPKATVSSLKDFLKNFKGRYILYLRDYNINPERFSESVASYEGMKYGFLSAMQSVLIKGIEFKKGYHCSEVQVLEMQKEGLLKGIDANKITPNTLMHLLINERFK